MARRSIRPPAAFEGRRPIAILNFSRAPHGGRVRLLPDNARASRITPRLLIYHSIVGSAEGAFRYFRDVTNLESTFIVTLGGEIWQLMDTTRQADANYRANPFAISVETEDRGDPDNQPWTAAQLDALAWLARECNRLHGIPLRRANRWDGSGIGYHVQFGAPGQWTPVSKSCPGRVRIRQFNQTLLPRITGGGEEGSDVPLTEDEWRRLDRMIERHVDRIYRLLARGEIDGEVSAAHFLDSTRRINNLLSSGVIDVGDQPPAPAPIVGTYTVTVGPARRAPAVPEPSEQGNGNPGNGSPGNGNPGNGNGGPGQ